MVRREKLAATTEELKKAGIPIPVGKERSSGLIETLGRRREEFYKEIPFDRRRTKGVSPTEKERRSGKDRRQN